MPRRTITRIATPHTEEDLLEVALAGTANHRERVVRLARAAGTDAAAATTGLPSPSLSADHRSPGKDQDLLPVTR